MDIFSSYSIWKNRLLRCRSFPNGQDLVFLFSPSSLSILSWLCAAPVLDVLAEQAVCTPAAALSILKCLSRLLGRKVEPQCHRRNHLAWNTDLACILCTKCNERDSFTKWQFPPINCASFLSFNLRHAINCDLLRLGTCLGLRWRQYSGSCGAARQSNRDSPRQQNN